MAYKGLIKDIEKCIRLEVPSRVPVFALSEEFDVRMSGIMYCDYNSNSKLMAESQINAIKKYDYDWAWLQVDDCIEFEVLGVGVKGGGNILPATCDYLPFSYETYHNLRIPDFKKEGRMPVLLDAIKRIKDEFGDTVCVTGRVAAPLSSVTLLYGMMPTYLGIYDNPQLVKDTVKFFTEMQTLWGIEQIKAGADALWVGDCNASGHLISVDTFMEFAFEGVKVCAENFKSAGGWSFYHASEHSIPHLKAMAKTGVSAVSAGPGVDIGEVKAAIGDQVCIIGNVNPIETLLEKTAEEVYEDAKQVMLKGKPGGGYIYNSGEMIPRDVPEENSKAMVKAGRDFGAY
jgi:uroporphyrinogen decarboxylase